MPQLLNKKEPLHISESLLQRYDRYQLVLIFVNSLLFSALFASDSIAVFLVRAAFNGTGIIMVLGLLSLTIGNIMAGARHRNEHFALFGSYYSSRLLLVFQAVFLAILAGWLMLKLV